MRTPVSMPAPSASSSIGSPPATPDARSVVPREEPNSPGLYQAQVMSAESDTQVISITRMPRDTDSPTRRIPRSGHFEACSVPRRRVRRYAIALGKKISLVLFTSCCTTSSPIARYLAIAVS